MKFYKTVEKAAEAEFSEKKSRFIGYVRPVTTEEEALAFLNQIRTSHPAATHHVYGYVLQENNIQRYSDDGEPSGTAGMPVLDTIKKEGLTDVIVVVVRYFGGTLLGTGGLVHAYGKAARLGLCEGHIVCMVYCNIFDVECDYSLLGKVQYEVKNMGHPIEATDYGAMVRLTVCVESSQSEAFQTKLVEATNALATVRLAGSRFVAMEPEET